MHCIYYSWIMFLEEEWTNRKTHTQFVSISMALCHRAIYGDECDIFNILFLQLLFTCWKLPFNYLKCVKHCYLFLSHFLFFVSPLVAPRLVCRLFGIHVFILFHAPSLQSNNTRHSFLCFSTERVNLHIKSRLCTKNEYEAMRWGSEIIGYGKVDRWRPAWHRFSNGQMNKTAQGGAVLIAGVHEKYKRLYWAVWTAIAPSICYLCILVTHIYLPTSLFVGKRKRSKRKTLLENFPWKNEPTNKIRQQSDRMSNVHWALQQQWKWIALEYSTSNGNSSDRIVLCMSHRRRLTTIT